MLRRRSIRLRILVLVLAPVVALAGLYAVILDLTLGQYLALRHASSERTAITQPVMKVQDALAAERGTALEYLISPDHSRFLRLLLAQEAKTDNIVRQFGAVAGAVLRSGVDPREQRAIRTLRSDLAGLSTLRTAVVGFGVSATAAAAAYSGKVTDGNDVLVQAMLPLVANTAAPQVSNVMTLSSSLQLFAEESDLLKAAITTHVFPAASLQRIGQLAAQRHELWNEAMPGLDPGYQDYFSQMIPSDATATLEGMEGYVAVGKQGATAVSLAAWTSSQTPYATGFRKAVLASESGLVSAASQQARNILTRLVLAAGFGLLAIAVAVSVAVVVSRRLIRELDDLRLSALSLASEGLPDAIERLRAGEALETETQTLLDSSPDEIGQVRLAFNTAARTAIEAAVQEIRIRRSVNDVFRNLARRNQSLLTRQLELLDAMERRVHDPEELADLFRIDHMTTRMRRHAEGLLIVAGSSSGRSWREPVPLVDVMRAAIAEVENYTRVRVGSRTIAALAGHAVADLIHLLAELVENATMFSPASTPVRIEGDRVARGLALEIEDRGLGMTEAKLAEMNAKLANPPMFDLSGSDQLGLFIAGQLAKRHDIKITLRSSPYGGITAVVLIPNSLVADVDADEQITSISIRELGGRPVPQLPAGSPLPGSQPTDDRAVSVLAAGGRRMGDGATTDVVVVTDGTIAGGAITGGAITGVVAADDEPAAESSSAGYPTTVDAVLASLGTATGLGADAPATAGPAWFRDDSPPPTGAGDSPASIPTPAGAGLPPLAGVVVPAPTGVEANPVSGGADGAQPFTPTAATGIPPAAAPRPVASSEPDVAGWRLAAGISAAPSRADNDQRADLPVRRPAMPATTRPGNGRDPSQAPPGSPAAWPDPDDLPVRVRQANLAPQLLKPSTADRTRERPHASPEAARNIMAAMQRGWERGRAVPDHAAEPAAAEPTSLRGSYAPPWATQPQVAPEQSDSEQELPLSAAPELASPGLHSARGEQQWYRGSRMHQEEQHEHRWQSGLAAR